MHGQSVAVAAFGNTEKCHPAALSDQFYTRSTASCSRPSNATSQGFSPFPGKKTPKKWRTIHEKYKKTAVIGQGTYGIVYKGEKRDETGNKVVALKRARLDAFTDFGIPETALREITILADLKHENIMELLELSCSTQRLYMVCEYLEMDLKKFIRANNRTISKTTVKKISYEILKGLAFCHGHRVMHRDLKPHNILLDKEGTIVKLADFGLARPKPSYNKTLTHEVVTLWYRAPELLLGHCRYSDAIDMWSVGCIVAEMFSGRALFPGDSEIDTLFKIFRLLGTPSSDEWPSGAMDPLASFPIFRRKENLFGSSVIDIDDTAVDFIERLLAYDPEKRLSAIEAIEHPWFDDVRTTSPRCLDENSPLASAFTPQFPFDESYPIAGTTTPRRLQICVLMNSRQCTSLAETVTCERRSENVNCTNLSIGQIPDSVFNVSNQNITVPRQHATVLKASPSVKQDNNIVHELIGTEVDATNKASTGFMKKHDIPRSQGSEGSVVEAIKSCASTATSSSSIIAPKNRAWWRWNRHGGRNKSYTVVKDSMGEVGASLKTDDYITQKTVNIADAMCLPHITTTSTSSSMSFSSEDTSVPTAKFATTKCFTKFHHVANNTSPQTHAQVSSEVTDSSLSKIVYFDSVNSVCQKHVPLVPVSRYGSNYSNMNTNSNCHVAGHLINANVLSGPNNCPKTSQSPVNGREPEYSICEDGSSQSVVTMGNHYSQQIIQDNNGPVCGVSVTDNGTATNCRVKSVCLPPSMNLNRYNPLRCLTGTTGDRRGVLEVNTSAITKGHQYGMSLHVGNSMSSSNTWCNNNKESDVIQGASDCREAPSGNGTTSSSSASSSSSSYSSSSSSSSLVSSQTYLFDACSSSSELKCESVLYNGPSFSTHSGSMNTYLNVNINDVVCIANPINQCYGGISPATAMYGKGFTENV